MKLDDGKYELKRVDNRLICLRHGEPWRDVTGDNLIYWLMTHLEETLEILIKYGQIDGDHHKAWTIDQAVRALTGGEYEEVIRKAKDGEDGPETYGWDKGTPP